MRKVGAGALAAGMVLACAAPAQGAEVSWQAGNFPVRAVIDYRAAPGEVNDIEVSGEPSVPGQPAVVRIVDHGATITTSAPVAPGSCDYPASSCRVPCEVVTPHEARCALADGYTYQEPVDERLLRQMDPTGITRRPTPTSTPAPPGGFSSLEISMDDGNDRLRTAEEAGVFAIASGGGGADLLELRSSARAIVGDGDTVRYPGVNAGGQVQIEGNADVYAADGSRQNIWCMGGGDPARVHLDPLDEFRCGSLIQDGVLP